MATNAISAVGSVSGNQPRVASVAEAITQTYLLGTPVMLDGSGNVIAWDGLTIGNGIAGISVFDANNIAVVGTPKTLTFGSVPNQSSAVNIPRGAPFSDANMLIEVANPDTIFAGQVGPAQLSTSIILGANYGLTKDTDNHWFVDVTNVNSPTSVVSVVAVDAFDTRGVRFVFLIDVCQLIA